jgi:hypothetical protein
MSLLISCVNSETSKSRKVDESKANQKEPYKGNGAPSRTDPNSYEYDEIALEELISYSGIEYFEQVKQDGFDIQELRVDKKGNFYVSQFGSDQTKEQIIDFLEGGNNGHHTFSNRYTLKGKIIGITYYGPIIENGKKSRQFFMGDKIYIQLSNVLYTHEFCVKRHFWNDDSKTVQDSVDESFTVHSREEELKYHHEKGEDNIIIDSDGSEVCYFSVNRGKPTGFSTENGSVPFRRMSGYNKDYYRCF